MSFFFQAIKDDHRHLVLTLLKNNPPLVNKRETSENITPLMHAIKCGHYRICQVLIEHGALVDEKDGNGNTALHMAIHASSLEWLGLLLRYDASINETDSDGFTVLHKACYFEDVTRFLLGNGAAFIKAHNGMYPYDMLPTPWANQMKAIHSMSLFVHLRKLPSDLIRVLFSRYVPPNREKTDDSETDCVFQ